MKTGVVFLLVLSLRRAAFVEDTAPTGVIVRQPRETDADAGRAVRAQLPAVSIALAVLYPAP